MPSTSAQPRILHLDSGREMGGGQWQVFRLLEGLAAAGVEGTLLAREGSPLFLRARDAGCRVEPFGMSRTFWRARGHDLVHAHDARGHTAATILRSVPLVVSRRVAFPVRSRWKYQRAAHYVAVSEYVRSELLRAAVPAEKISVVYDAVPLLPCSTRSGPIIAPANKAMPLPDVALHLSSNLEQDLRSASLFVYVTASEGLGSAVLLAMSAAVPVIASHIGGIPEIIRDGENGILVPNESSAFSAAIRRVREDPALAASLGAAGRRAVAERFGQDRMVRRTMEIYRQVLS